MYAPMMNLPSLHTKATAQLTFKLTVALLTVQAKSKFKWITISSFNEWIAQVRQVLRWHAVHQHVHECRSIDVMSWLTVPCWRHSPRAATWRRRWAWRRTHHSLAAPSSVRRPHPIPANRTAGWCGIGLYACL